MPLPRLTLAAALAGVVSVLALASAPVASANRNLESMFQDDNHLVYATPARVAKTMDELKALGVDRLRITVLWKIVAPDALDETRPAGFDASDPAAYPPGSWSRFDTIVRLAAQKGLKVDFNVTGPAPLWATGNPDRKDIDETYDPNPAEFDAFVRAVGTRYSGTYDGLPRVDYWTVWNEPNQGGWLTPQWGQDPRGGKQMVETSPRIYRGLVDAAYDALVTTGHGKDTFLIGETAPKGDPRQGETRAMAPGRFIRRLYCLDDNGQSLLGTSAEVEGCPVNDAHSTFPNTHPGLFHVTGWAHHPYELFLSPTSPPADKDWFTIANLGRLGDLLRRAFLRYSQPLPGGSYVPLYLTEFGYQTDPPDPLGVSLSRQAAYINQAQYIAWRSKAVRTLSQFLLVDDKPLPGVSTRSAAAWGKTFQSGLKQLNGRHKTAYGAYELPIYVRGTRVRRGGRVAVWGQVRIAPRTVRPVVRIQARGAKGSAFRTVKTVHASTTGYFDVGVRIRRSGALRLAYRPVGGRTQHSRSVTVTVR